jgi:ubiquinone/menaquinone biosynthesis C-methylase UbiE
MSDLSVIQEHYTSEDLPARVQDALTRAGIWADKIDWADLAQIDQFHVRGLPATLDLANALNPSKEDWVLDVGSGLGGPARCLAATHGCHVTGIDLTEPFVEVATMLAEKCGLAGLLEFRSGNALSLPFPDASFDHAWTIHVAMNIPDKEGLYREVSRVLKPGGRFGIYDVIQGEGGPVTYPVPWAKDASSSFLANSSELTHALETSGFREISSVDTTQIALPWFAEIQGVQSKPNLSLVMGPEFREMAQNVFQNLSEDRVRLIQVVVQKV